RCCIRLVAPGGSMLASRWRAPVRRRPPAASTAMAPAWGAARLARLLRSRAPRAGASTLRLRGPRGAGRGGRGHVLPPGGPGQELPEGVRGREDQRQRARGPEDDAQEGLRRGAGRAREAAAGPRAEGPEAAVSDPLAATGPSRISTAPGAPPASSCPSPSGCRCGPSASGPRGCWRRACREGRPGGGDGGGEGEWRRCLRSPGGV
ncbi:unnamed protein product, partial [Prorocentrum cordatum]